MDNFRWSFLSCFLCDIYVHLCFVQFLFVFDSFAFHCFTGSTKYEDQLVSLDRSLEDDWLSLIFIDSDYILYI